MAGHPERATFRDIVEGGWSGQASPDSVAYRLTRVFREQVAAQVIRFLLAECYEADPAFDYLTVRRREGPIWALVTEKPQHLLDPQYATWDDLLLAAVDEVIAQTLDGRQVRCATACGPTTTSPRIVTRCRHRCRSSAAGSICPAGRCRATSSHRACIGARQPPRNGWSCLPGVKPRASCTCPRARAGIRSRPSTATRTRRGSTASPRHFYPARRSTL